jgi:hypothetical protein
MSVDQLLASVRFWSVTRKFLGLLDLRWRRVSGM